VSRKDRSRRYETANNLARDVERYLKNEPITARPPSRAYQFQKFIRRNKLAFASITAVTLALVMGLGTSVRMFFKEAALRQRAEKAEHETQRQLHAALVQEARGCSAQRRSGPSFPGARCLRRAVAISNTVEMRREALAALALPDFRFERQFDIPEGARAALDPTFTRVAIGLGTNAVEIRSTSDQRLLVTMAPSTNDAFIMEWSHDGRYFAVARRKTSGRYDLEICDASIRPTNALRSRYAFWCRGLSPDAPANSFFGEGERSDPSRFGGGRTINTYTVAGLIYFLRFSPAGERFAVQHGSPQPWTRSRKPETTSIIAADSGETRLSVARVARGDCLAPERELDGSWRNLWRSAVTQPQDG
jgi:hypothetical protein